MNALANPLADARRARAFLRDADVLGRHADLAPDRAAARRGGGARAVGRTGRDDFRRTAAAAGQSRTCICSASSRCSGGAAAIVSYGGEPARAVSLGGPLTQGVKLSEVRARSIIIDRNGVKSEMFLPQNPPGPTIYVR